MGTFEDIRSARRLVLAGVWVSVSMAVAGLALFIANLELAAGNVLAALAWVTVLAIPPAWAWLSLDRRQSLLPAAAMASLVMAVAELLAFVPPVHLVAALLLWLGHRRRFEAANPVSPWKRPLMAAALVLPAMVMGSHLDPICMTVAADGTEITSPYQRAATGWRLGFGGGTTETSATEADGPDADETTTCTSDTTVWWEGVVGLLTALGVATPGLRWKVNSAAPPDRLPL